MTEDHPISTTLLLVNITEILFTISTAIARELTKNRGIGVIEFCFVRNLLNFVFSIVIWGFTGEPLFG